MKIAILLASFNRKEKTLACIQRLTDQHLPETVTLDIHLTDDASPDGTAEAVRTRFPQVNIYQGDGYYYWAGGMRTSWHHARETRPDFYLLLNDDVFLFDDAIARLLAWNERYKQERGNETIVVGPTKDGITGKVSYGGRNTYSKYRPQYYLVYSDDNYVECDLGDGNIMLVPAAVVDKVGILSEEWTHGLGDHDYTFRAKNAGFSLIAAPGFYGICTFDKGKGWKSGKVKLSERLEYLYSPTGLQYKQYMAFIRRYYPYDLPMTFIKLWIKTLFPIVYDLFKKDDRHWVQF